MNNPFFLREALIEAAKIKGLINCDDGQLPPITFHYITPDSEFKGHLSTPWAFSLCAVCKTASAQEAAAIIASEDPNWNAKDGYINITLTEAQLDYAVHKCAVAFDNGQYPLISPDDSHENFLMEYFIYIAAQGPGSMAKTAGNPGPAIVYAALGGSCGLLAQELYRYYRTNYGGEESSERTLPYLKAAAEIFTRQLYKTS